MDHKLDIFVEAEAKANSKAHKVTADKIVKLFQEAGFSIADAKMTLCMVDDGLTRFSQRVKL